MPDTQPPTTGAIIPTVTLAAGDYVYRAGDASPSFFIVGSGQIEILKAGDTFRRLALLGPGDVFGEDTAFGGQPRSCDARAAATATALEVPVDLFLRLVQARPDVATAVMRATAARLMQAHAACLALARPMRQQGMAVGTPAVGRIIHVESGTQFPVPNQSEIVIGRADPRMKFLPDIDLSAVDTHRSLSRRHAVVTHVDEAFRVLEGPKVANGTFHNGTRLTAGTAVSLADGDEVSFGLVRTVFRLS